VQDDLDELVQMPLRLAGVEVSGLLYENAEGRIKLSLRSRERVNVNAVCRAFGGGGHFLASGAKLDGPMEAAYGQVSTVLEAQIRQDVP
jgi:phosphoesterase RecJ-like protein